MGCTLASSAGIRLNCPCAAAILLFVKLLWPLVISAITVNDYMIIVLWLAYLNCLNYFFAYCLTWQWDQVFYVKLLLLSICSVPSTLQTSLQRNWHFVHKKIKVKVINNVRNCEIVECGAIYDGTSKFDPTVCCNRPHVHVLVICRVWSAKSNRC